MEPAGACAMLVPSSSTPITLLESRPASSTKYQWQAIRAHSRILVFFVNVKNNNVNKIILHSHSVHVILFLFGGAVSSIVYSVIFIIIVQLACVVRFYENCLRFSKSALLGALQLQLKMLICLAVEYSQNELQIMCLLYFRLTVLSFTFL